MVRLLWNKPLVVLLTRLFTICALRSFFNRFGITKLCEIMSWTPIIENISPISVGFQWNVSIMNCEKTACKEPFRIQSKNAETNSLFKFFMESTFASCVNGFNLTKIISFN